MRNILEEYMGIAGFLKKSLGNLYDVFVLEYADGAWSAAEGDCADSEGVTRCIPLAMECVRDSRICLNQIVGTEAGKAHKVSVRMIRGEAGDVIGALCVSLQCGPFLRLVGLANEFLNPEMIHGESGEYYPCTIEGLERYIRDYPMQSARPNRNERTEIICDLYNMGMFNVKGAVARAADLLSISEKSVYRYVKEIREARG